MLSLAAITSNPHHHHLAAGCHPNGAIGPPIAFDRQVFTTLRHRPLAHLCALSTISTSFKTLILSTQGRSVSHFHCLQILYVEVAQQHGGFKGSGCLMSAERPPVQRPSPGTINCIGGMTPWSGPLTLRSAAILPIRATSLHVHLVGFPPSTSPCYNSALVFTTVALSP